MLVPKPPWLKIQLRTPQEFLQVGGLVKGLRLRTVCQEARCPNIYECWSSGTAAFMILGETCTRHCGFCAVRKGKGEEVDLQEPEHVAEAARRLGLSHVVITSVSRDDLPDQGAGQFARTVSTIRERHPRCRIELLVPDFQGSRDCLEAVLHARPDVLNHNMETVERLYRRVRPEASYQNSLDLLAEAARWGKGEQVTTARERGFAEERVGSQGRALMTKSGVMVGLGETLEELEILLGDLREAGCEILTVGQYLPPTTRHLPVEKYYHPDEFALLREKALCLGFSYVESGPLVRSSYHAEQHALRGDCKVPDRVERQIAEGRSQGLRDATGSSGVLEAPVPSR